MTDLGTIDGDAVRFERDLPGPVERIWSYLTEGPLLTTWLAASGAIPSREGESFVLDLGGGDDTPEREGYSAAMYGTVLTYDPPHVLAYTWGVKAPDGSMLNSTLRFELVPHGERVTLILTHRPIVPGFASRTLAGWHTLLDRLVARLDNREPPNQMHAFRAIEPRYAD